MSIPPDPVRTTKPTLPPLEEKPVPRWEKLSAVAYVVLIALAVVAFRDRLSADFWPLDASRIAPNILATVVQIAAYTPIVILLWPPFRRRLHRFVERHTAPLHEHFERLHEQRERHHDEQMAVLHQVHAHVKQALPPEKTG